ncbi:MAG: addiction module protein [Bacteroidales bacterium]|nr:addiction module protein [Bacteroidales bacterium]
MGYSIQIKDTESELAKKLLDYLRSLAKTKEYDFLKITDEDELALSEEQKDELDQRYEHFLKHHEKYSDWDEVKHKYLK